MPKKVTAKDGDTLCGLAIDAGFVDCTQVRKHADNKGFCSRPLKAGDVVTIPELKATLLQKASNSLYKFFKKSAPPVSIRFVRGKADEKHYMHDFDETELQISNYVANKAGLDRTKSFPSGFGYDEHADADPCAFRVEVVDPAAGGSVNAVLEALKPVYKNDGTIEKYESFSDGEAAKRKIAALECKPLKGAPKAFRSRYLRLVVDKGDKDGLPDQTLLMKDLVDAGDEKVEILDQKVRASYIIPRCPGTGGRKCQVTAELPVGRDRWRLKLAVHYLKRPAGTTYANVDDTRKRLLKFTRQYFAQANMSLKILSTAEVPSPANMFAIANETGKNATGGTVIVEVKINGVQKRITITTAAGDKPVDTATKLADEINLVFLAESINADSRVFENPACLGKAQGSADVLVGDPQVQTIEVAAVQEDPGQSVSIGVLDGTEIQDWGTNDAHVGTIQERVLFKNYDTGDDRIDLFIVNSLKGAYGEGAAPRAHRPAAERRDVEFRNSVIIAADGITEDQPTTFPHEFGHVLMDAYHANVDTELMDPQTGAKADSRAVDGPKRIADPVAPLEIDMDCKKGSPLKFLRGENTTILEQSW